VSETPSEPPAAPSLLTEELRGWIGREVSYEAPEELGRAAIRYHALALGDDNPLYRDEQHASATRFGGVIAPPTLVVETNQYTDLPTRPEDGYNGHAWEGLPLSVPCTLVRGGNEYELLQPVRPDDRLHVRWSIEEITERQGRAGPMLVLLALGEYRNQRGEPLATNRDTTIFLPVTPPSEATASAEAGA